MKPNEQPIQVILASSGGETANHVIRSLAETAPGGFMVTRAESFSQIYSLLNEQPCDLLLLDWHMRSMSLATVTGLRQSEPTMAIVIFTDPEDTGIGHKIVSAGAEECVCLLNLAPKDLRNLLRNAAQRHQLSTESEAMLILRCKKLEAMVPVDEASGLNNASAFDALLEKEILRSIRHGGLFTLVLVEIDNFAALADTYGPRSFLTIIRLFADSLRGNVRRVDDLGRVGRGRFAVLCVESRMSDVNVLVQRVMVHARSNPLNLGSGIKVNISVSCGMAEWSQSMTNPGQFMAAAAEALAKAQAKGRDQVATAKG